jgi:ATP-dependent DNA helicase RecG
MPDKLPINLEDLLHQRTVESERIEYKAGWNPDPIIRTLCAFANDFENLGGGYVVIGQDCDPNGLPIFPAVGLLENQLDKIQQELLAACQLIHPPYFPALSIHEIEDQRLIVLQAPGGLNRPYKAPASVSAKHKTWHYYIRRYTSTVEAKGATEQELLTLTAQVPFDDRFAQQARVSDLSKTLMIEYLREVGSVLANVIICTRRLLSTQTAQRLHEYGISPMRQLKKRWLMLFIIVHMKNVNRSKCGSVEMN